MGLISKIFHLNQDTTSNTDFEPIKLLKNKYTFFKSILENNYECLKLISDLEEKNQGEFLFDKNYIVISLDKIEGSLENLLDNLILLGGSNYKKLATQFNIIKLKISNTLEPKPAISEDKFTIPFIELDKDQACRVGSKNAQLGELMTKLNINVPNGFAITANAYRYFINENDIENKIANLINTINIKDYKELEHISEQIQGLINESPVPEDLSSSIYNSYLNLIDFTRPNSEFNELVSMRSSAIGEDTNLSFAGQYATILGVKEENLLDSFKKVLASKFSPKAIYYLLSHNLSESNFAMSVGCVQMVDAIKSGVIYTVNPVSPDDNTLLLNSIYGLGKFLVDGTVTPDSFVLNKFDRKIVETNLSMKTDKLCLRPNSEFIPKAFGKKSEVSGTISIPIPDNEQGLPSLSKEEIISLFEIGIKIEEHYGQPQDIEWAISKEGIVYILQTRPLRIIKKTDDKLEIDTSDFKILLKEGKTASPGAGNGIIYLIKSPNDYANVPDNSVIVAENPFPNLVSVLGKAKALITKVGGVASHLVTVAREYRIPTLVGVKSLHKLEAGKLVTVDATNSIIYDGDYPELVEALTPEYDTFDDNAIFQLLHDIIEYISPLNLVDSSDNSFTIGNCRTYHDILRFAHQKSIEEMFNNSAKIGVTGIGVPLKSPTIPLKVEIISIDDISDGLKQTEDTGHKKACGRKKANFISDSEISSLPFKAFWEGILEVGWVLPPAAPDIKSFMTVMGTDASSQKINHLSEKSYVISGKDFMILNLRMGYHFTTVEAMATPINVNNYIKMKFKDGGASFDRRIRRIKLVSDILIKIGFKANAKGDYLEIEAHYDSQDGTLLKLIYLGKITMLTRQLDMALKDDDEMENYKEEILGKLGLKN